MNIETLLSQRLGKSEVIRIAAWTQEDTAHMDKLWQLVHSDDRRVSVNALWVMTHLPESGKEWLRSLQDALADMLLAETDGTKKRILLQILRNQEYDPQAIRTDLLDFCFSRINSECEPYAVRCFSMYLAFNMCRHYPELIAELEEYLDLLGGQPLSPGLKSGLRQTRANIARIRRKTKP